MQLDVDNEPYLSKQWCLDHLLTWFFLECSQWYELLSSDGIGMTWHWSILGLHNVTLCWWKRTTYLRKRDSAEFLKYEFRCCVESMVSIHWFFSIFFTGIYRREPTRPSIQSICHPNAASEHTTTPNCLH